MASGIALDPLSTETTFSAMGSEGHLIIVGGPGDATAAALGRIDELEARWSRFRPTSEVSRLTEQAGEWVEVTPDTMLLVERAVDAWRLTGGSFDPTVLGDVIRAGYDVTFDDVRAAPHRGRSRLLIGCTDIAMDGTAIRLPADTGFDPGGIGKGLGADIVVEEAIAAGVDGICVNLGGDLRVWGTPAGGGGWGVGVIHPWADEPIAQLVLQRGAVATSTTLGRRWQVEGETFHHLIDPATGSPSSTDLNAVTVIASEGWAAEVLAKAVLLRGVEHPFDLLGGTGAEAIAVADDGRVLATPGISPFLAGAQLPTHLEPKA